jgi:riboflavin biosynthesis pyrimidine reductase
VPPRRCHPRRRADFREDPLGVGTPIAEGFFEDVGASIMGRRMTKEGRRSTSSRTGSRQHWRGANGKAVSLGGGAEVATQYLAAGLLDEMVISIVPLILGAGSRLCGGLGDARPKLEQLQVVEAPGVTHIRYAPVR